MGRCIDSAHIAFEIHTIFLPNLVTNLAVLGEPFHVIGMGMHRLLAKTGIENARQGAITNAAM